MSLFEEEGMNFVAIDFETATAHRNSACSVAVVKVTGGIVRDGYHTLIQPPDNEYSEDTIAVHGIRPRDTARAKNFASIWAKLSTELEGKLVVAHNASFDMSVLAGGLRHYGLSPVNFYYADTVGIARKSWPQLENHKLNTVAEYLGVSLRHHDALEDARACAWIPLRAAQEKECDSFGKLAKTLGVRIGRFRL